MRKQCYGKLRAFTLKMANDILFDMEILTFFKSKSAIKIKKKGGKILFPRVTSNARITIYIYTCHVSR